MGFGSGGGSGSIGGSSDAALNNPSDGQVLTYNGSLGKWQNQAAAGGSSLNVQDEGTTLTSAATSLNFAGSGVTATTSGTAVTVTVGGSSGTGVPGAVYFDTFFAGANDNAKIIAMNTYHQGIAAGAAHPVIMFDTRTYSFSTSIILYSGMALLGGKQSAAREFSTATILNYQGGTCMFTFPGSQSGQGYPSDGSPRDISISDIQMNGGSTVDCIQKYDPSTSSNYQGHTLWNSRFHNCGWVGFNTIWWGWGDGAVIDGVTHLQAVNSTAFCIGGSECRIFGNDSYSYIDNSSAGWQSSGLPFLRSLMAKSFIGSCMFSARSNSYQISVEGGYSLTIAGAAVDAPDSAPTYGAGIKISAGTGVTITGCSFKGVMTAPGSAGGGTSGNKGWIHVSGGSQISVIGCNFYRGGNNVPSESVPLLYTASGVAQGAVKWGYNNYNNFSANATLQQATSGQILSQTDSNLTVNTAP